MAASKPWALIALLRAEALQDPGVSHAPPPLREGLVFAHVLEHMPIGILPGTGLVGEFGPDYCTPAQLARWLPEDEAPSAAPQSAAEPSPVQLMAERFHCRGSDGGNAHTTVDYGRVVEEGLWAIVAQVEARRGGASEEQRAYLDGMGAALRGVIRWAERYAELAERLAAQAEERSDRGRLLQVARHCRRVPGLPARTFAEAVQGIWLVHLAVGLSEGSGSSLSLGRLDQYLLPLFTRDLDRGVPLEDVEAALAELFRALNDFFGDPACAVNLGGAGEGGEDQFNPLSRMIVETAGRLRLPAPILAARIHRNLSQEAFDLYTDAGLVEIGQPTFYGEEACVQALLRRGVPESDVHGWAANSCMGLMMPGQEWSNMWGSVVNLLLPLELALNGGRPFIHELPLDLHTPPVAGHADFESLFGAVCRYTEELVDLLISHTAQATERRGRERPNPFVSALLADCIERGRDRLRGGCRYQTVIVEAFGLVNVADALVAIRELTFERGSHTLDALVRAARADWEGHEDILHAVRRAPKFGNGDPVADEMTCRLTDCFAAFVSRHSRDGLYYLPSFHTLNAHIAAGAATAASLDGRRAGEPLAKNIGTSPGRATSGHTALMRSAASIDQAVFNGGQALDIRVDPGLLRTSEGRRKFQALLRTYFDMGGLQVQVNGLSADVLRRAVAEPEAHRDLIVRIAGYSAVFVSLPTGVQEEMVARFEAGM